MYNAKLNAKLQKDLYEHLLRGAFINTACELVGISTPTYYRWFNEGKDGDPKFEPFYSAMLKAQALAESNAVGKLMFLANGDEGEERPPDFRALRFFLERRYPTRWGEKRAIDEALDRQAKDFLSRAKEVLSPESLEALLGVIPLSISDDEEI